jgi:hypothetical protein
MQARGITSGTLSQLLMDRLELAVTLLRPVLGGVRATENENPEDAGGDVHGRRKSSYRRQMNAGRPGCKR